MYLVQLNWFHYTVHPSCQILMGWHSVFQLCAQVQHRRVLFYWLLLLPIIGMTKDRQKWLYAAVEVCTYKNACGDTCKGMLSNRMALYLLIIWIRMCERVLRLCMLHFLCLYHRSENFYVMKLLYDNFENINFGRNDPIVNVNSVHVFLCFCFLCVCEINFIAAINYEIHSISRFTVYAHAYVWAHIKKLMY